MALLGTLSYPKVPPQDATATYNISKELESKTILPSVRVDLDLFKLHYFNAKFKLEGALNRLKERRNQAKDKKRYMQSQWRRLEELEETLKQQIVRSDEFMVENEEKRARSKQRILHMTHLFEERSEMIETMKENMKELKDVKRQMEEKVKAYVIYQDYMEAVVQRFPTKFKTVDEILTRFELLETTKSKILQAQTNLADQLKTSYEEMKKNLYDQLVQQTGVITQLEQMQLRYEKARKESLKAEQLLSKIYKDAAMSRNEFITVKRNCWRMYQHMRKKKFLSTSLAENDFEGQLKEINKVIGILDTVFTKLGLH